MTLEIINEIKKLPLNRQEAFFLTYRGAQITHSNLKLEKENKFFSFYSYRYMMMWNAESGIYLQKTRWQGIKIQDNKTTFYGCNIHWLFDQDELKPVLAKFSDIRELSRNMINTTKVKSHLFSKEEDPLVISNKIYNSYKLNCARYKLEELLKNFNFFTLLKHKDLLSLEPQEIKDRISKINADKTLDEEKIVANTRGFIRGYGLNEYKVPSKEDIIKIFNSPLLDRALKHNPSNAEMVAAVSKAREESTVNEFGW